MRKIRRINWLFISVFVAGLAWGKPVGVGPGTVWCDTEDRILGSAGDMSQCNDVKAQHYQNANNKNHVIICERPLGGW